MIPDHSTNMQSEQPNVREVYITLLGKKKQNIAKFSDTHKQLNVWLLYNYNLSN